MYIYKYIDIYTCIYIHIYIYRNVTSKETPARKNFQVSVQ